MRAHFGQRGQLERADRLDDVALAHAVAAADLGVIGHGLVVDRLRAAAFRLGEGLAEYQPFAQGGNVLLVAHQFQVPLAIDDVPVQHHADQASIAQHDLLVDAAGLVAQHDLFIGLVRRHQRAGGKHFHAGDLEAGRQGLAGEDGRLVACQPRTAYLGLIPDRRHQAEHLAAVLDALAHRKNERVAGAHVVAHHDAAVDLQPGSNGQLDARTNADRQHHQVGGNLAPVFQQNAFGVIDTGDLLGLALGEEGNAATIEITLQQLAGGGIELAFHQGRHQVHQRHRHAALAQTPCSLQPQQPATDDHRMPVRARSGQHLVDVGNIAERTHAGQLQPRNARRQWLGAGRDQQAVVGHADAIRRSHRARIPIDGGDLVAGDQADAIFLVPLARVDDDLVQLLVAGQHAGQHDAVVIDVGLGTEHGDAIALAAFVLEQLLHRAHGGHAIADHHQLRDGWKAGEIVVDVHGVAPVG